MSDQIFIAKIHVSDYGDVRQQVADGLDAIRNSVLHGEPLYDPDAAIPCRQITVRDEDDRKIGTAGLIWDDDE